MTNPHVWGLVNNYLVIYPHLSRVSHAGFFLSAHGKNNRHTRDFYEKRFQGLTETDINEFTLLLNKQNQSVKLYASTRGISLFRPCLPSKFRHKKGALAAGSSAIFSVPQSQSAKAPSF